MIGWQINVIKNSLSCIIMSLALPRNIQISNAQLINFTYSACPSGAP